MAATVTLGLCLLVASCATDAPPPQLSVTPLTLPPVARRLPHFKVDFNHDAYPVDAHRRDSTGRVLIAFRIGADGRATDLWLSRSEAEPVLQSAALSLVRDIRFDTADPAYDPQNATPFGISVRFCIVNCYALVPFQGYEANDVAVTGSRISPGPAR